MFAKYDHGDQEAFDGKGGIIAHSGYPSDGIVHLDGSEFWSINGKKGLDLRYVSFQYSYLIQLQFPKRKSMCCKL